MKLLSIITLFSVLAVTAPTARELSASVEKREVGEVSTDYIFTDDPSEGSKTGQKKREVGEVSTDYIFTDDPSDGSKTSQKKR
ncbi:uncharacterized protein GLRG_08177 [Colletotrichum graminicola M1.001]|uniref:Uncharacterized protein n=1 Tax=Colletotrichum graminicola (strain M1.001 / M2 / FGSC 10212) TaxID=645133 RepID=E3QQ95_COLGM|nr:uncharacterized protein GLRG_08177 [Colletotrichum graminicola M1.001]EFQ33033.1 hypothetical protein GLRG_08177 [Colletotrichum graminicola M1.001]